MEPFRNMHCDKKSLEEATDALRFGMDIPLKLGVDPQQIDGRSAVFERNFSQNGKSLPAFLKIYTYRKHPLERLFRAGRSRIEARNLLFFKNIGIPVANVLAWGERRNRISKPMEEFIITEAVLDTQPIDKFVAEHCPDRSTKLYADRRDQILRKLAQYTAKIHQAHFFHKDLKWRNVLARLRGENVELFWIDCPSGDFHEPPWPQKHGRLKDCATLDKIARFECSQEERIRFISYYLNLPEDSSKVRTFAQEVSKFRTKRFDPKDNEQRKDAANVKKYV